MSLATAEESRTRQKNAVETIRREPPALQSFRRLDCELDRRYVEPQAFHGAPESVFESLNLKSATGRYLQELADRIVPGRFERQTAVIDELEFDRITGTLRVVVDGEGEILPRNAKAIE